MFATALPSDSAPSRMPTASPTWTAVASVRRLRLAAPRRPIWALRGRKRMCRRPRSSAPWPPTADPVALSASASERRDARRIAGIAASAGPISPTARLIASIVPSTWKPAEMP